MYRLEKGRKYVLREYDDPIEGEYVGVWRRSSSFGTNYRLVFKLDFSNFGFCTAEPSAKIREDGTIYIQYDIAIFYKDLEDLKKEPPPLPYKIDILDASYNGNTLA